MTTLTRIGSDRRGDNTARVVGTVFDASDLEKLSARAFLATERRVPGLGNGVLRDILLRAGINPRIEASSLSAKQR